MFEIVKQTIRDCRISKSEIRPCRNAGQKTLYLKCKFGIELSFGYTEREIEYRHWYPENQARELLEKINKGNKSIQLMEFRIRIAPLLFNNYLNIDGSLSDTVTVYSTFHRSENDYDKENENSIILHKQLENEADYIRSQYIKKGEAIDASNIKHILISNFTYWDFDVFTEICPPTISYDEVKVIPNKKFNISIRTLNIKLSEMIFSYRNISNILHQYSIKHETFSSIAHFNAPYYDISFGIDADINQLKQIVMLLESDSYLHHIYLTTFNDSNIYIGSYYRLIAQRNSYYEGTNGAGLTAQEFLSIPDDITRHHLLYNFLDFSNRKANIIIENDDYSSDYDNYTEDDVLYDAFEGDIDAWREYYE